MVASPSERSGSRLAPKDQAPKNQVEAGDAAPVAVQAEAPAPKKSRSRSVVLFAVLALAGLGAGGYVYSRRNLESTDNAQIDGEVIQVPARTSGTVAKVLFEENQPVHTGDVIALIDDAPAQAKVKQAEARLAAAKAAADAADADARIAGTNASGNSAVAKAQLSTASMGALSVVDQIKVAETAVTAAETSRKQAQDDRDRAKALFDERAIAQAELDRSETALALASTNLDMAKAKLDSLRLTRAQAQSKVAEANAKATQVSDVDAVVAEAEAHARAAHAEVDTASAALDLARLDLSYTEIKAPADGILSKKSISVGQALTAGQPVAELVTPEIWVSANFKETQIEKMRVGQPAEIEVDSFPGVKLRGKIESFSAATGSKFTLLPPDNATGNFTKVVQRLPCRVHIDEIPKGLELRPGMSVELTIDTR